MLTLSDVPIKMNEISYNDKCKNILFSIPNSMFLDAH